jgi:hypothetical protein
MQHPRPRVRAERAAPVAVVVAVVAVVAADKAVTLARTRATLTS